MTTKKRSASAPESVESFLEALDHPHKPTILALRRIILAADPRIGEEVKWNAPSFRTAEHFATFHLRARDGVQVVLHLGAKVRGDTPASGIAVADPHGLLEWRTGDRATATFRDEADVAARGAAFAEIIRQWIAHV